MRAYSTHEPRRRKGQSPAAAHHPTATTPGAPPTPDDAGGAAPGDPASFGPLPDDLSALGLPANALLLLDKLRFFYCRARPSCWPSDAELVRRTGLSIHQVRRALHRLEADGLIRRRTAALRYPGGLVRRRRVINLLVAAPGTGARSDSAPARTADSAPARNQEVVVVEGQWKSRQGPQADGRPRPIRAAGVPGLPRRETAPATGGERSVPTGSPIAAPTITSPSPTPPSRQASDKKAIAAPTPLFAGPGGDPPAPPPATSPPPTPADRAPETPSPTSSPRRPRPTLTNEALEALAVDDPILAGELARRRAAAERFAAVAARTPPSTTFELLARIREDPSHVAWATQALAVEFGDEKSWRGLHALCRRAYEGELEPEALVHAYGKALGPQVHNPGAIFTIEVRRRGQAVAR